MRFWAGKTWQKGAAIHNRPLLPPKILNCIVHTNLVKLSSYSRYIYGGNLTGGIPDKIIIGEYGCGKNDKELDDSKKLFGFIGISYVGNMPCR